MKIVTKKIFSFIKRDRTYGRRHIASNKKLVHKIFQSRIVDKIFQ